MNSICPVCSKPILKSLLERHVNSCLDNQEGKTKDGETTRLPSTSTIESIDVKPRKRDAFFALGLKADGHSLSESLKKRPKPESRSFIQHHHQTVKASHKDPKSLEEQFKIIAKGKEEMEEKEGKEEKEGGQNQKKLANKPETTESSSGSSSSSSSTSNSGSGGGGGSTISSQPPQTESRSNPKENIAELRRRANIPLAHRLRPKTLDEFIGQEKLLGKNAPLRNIIKADLIPSFLLWGPPGCGKTTLARIIARTTSCKFVELSGADSNAKHLKEVFTQAENQKRLTGQRTILFLDEIHRYNKAVQDLLLPILEKGICTVIGATTENPSFVLNNALLSRVHTFVMDSLTTESVVKILTRALFDINQIRRNLFHLHYMTLEDEAFTYIAELCMGDSRIALNILETVNAYLSSEEYNAKEVDGFRKQGVIKVTVGLLKQILKSRNFHQTYDRAGDAHYDIISAFHKSVRGSDPNAAMFYLVKMLSGGEDPMFILRRMIVIASEDIGLRDSSCLPFMMAAKEAVEFVGMPEGEIILAHCANKLARAPKSTKSYRSLRSAQKLISEHPEFTRLAVPIHLKNAPTGLMKEMGFGAEYKYNPKYENGIVNQTYFPDGMQPVKFLEDTHLGTLRDPNVADELYEQANEAKEDYEKYKRDKREFLKKEKESNDVPTENKNENDANDEMYYDEYNQDQRDGDSDDPDSTNNFGKSYDEFLDRDSQPEYFDEEVDILN
ncbi:MGS1 [Candida oxycetoniae]|uniref:MGS1 n=1 Tax=Candida oxycetoniae TaxID=497107 RepID=A0AAI9SVM2_9ASCO|nr:MGS1 [Candida oxycetoniae]KAI3403906.1 MGS1 [Candida oxycetoniae]